jgi:hypothetical protein
MAHRSIRSGELEPGRTYSEVGIFEHDGREYVANGAFVNDDLLIGYLGADGLLTRWDGEVIGRYVIAASWPTPRSYVSSHQHQVIATLRDGRTYTGRSAGRQMVLHATRVAADRLGRRQ